MSEPKWEIRCDEQGEATGARMVPEAGDGKAIEWCLSRGDLLALIRQAQRDERARIVALIDDMLALLGVTEEEIALCLDLRARIAQAPAASADGGEDG